MHAFTGTDTTSAFFRKGKVGPLKILENNVQYVDSFSKLGACSLEILEVMLLDIERFVCTMHGKRNYQDVNKLRCDLFKWRYHCNSSNLKLQHSDFAFIPPCKAIETALLLIFRRISGDILTLPKIIYLQLVVVRLQIVRMNPILIGLKEMPCHWNLQISFMIETVSTSLSMLMTKIFTRMMQLIIYWK